MSLGYTGKFLQNENPSVFQKVFFRQSIVISTQVQFADVSFYQGVINWDEYKKHSPAVIIRAGQNLWIDPQFERNYLEAKRVGLKRGVYWFYDSRIHPDAQADILIGLLKDDHPEMEVFCDWEYNYGGSYFDLKYAVQFMKKLETYLPGVKVGMYTGYYFFKDNTSAVTHANEYNYLKVRHLWLAWYTSNPNYVQIPAPWSMLTHWQYTSAGPGLEWGMQSNGLDLNYYKGTEQEFQQSYGGTVTDPPPINGGIVVTDSYANGVKILTGREYESDYKVVIVPPAAIYKADLKYDAKCHQCIEFPEDVVVNWSSFDACNKVNTGLRLNGADIVPYNLTNYAPWISPNSDQSMNIDHIYKLWKTRVSAAQGFRYIIEDGYKNPNNSGFEWLETHPRTLVGKLSDGSTVIIVVRGRDTANKGWTLHEAAVFGLSLSVVQMVEGDGGGSTQLLIRYSDGTYKDFWGVEAEHRAVPVFLTIKLKEPLVSDTTPPPPPTTDEWPLYFYLEKPDGTRQKYNKEVL